MDRPNVDKSLIDEQKRSKRIFKWLFFGLLIGFLLMISYALFASPEVKFNFTNGGKLICAERRGWNFKTGEVTCYQILKLE